MHACFSCFPWYAFVKGFCGSLETDIVFDGVNAGVDADRVLLKNDLLLDQSVHLLFEEVALVAIVDLDLVEILLQVSNVFDDFLQDVIGGLSGVMLESSTLWSEQLHLLFIVLQKFDRFFAVSL